MKWQLAELASVHCSGRTGNRTDTIWVSSMDCAAIFLCLPPHACVSSAYDHTILEWSYDSRMIIRMIIRLLRVFCVWSYDSGNQRCGIVQFFCAEQWLHLLVQLCTFAVCGQMILKIGVNNRLEHLRLLCPCVDASAPTMMHIAFVWSNDSWNRIWQRKGASAFALHLRECVCFTNQQKACCECVDQAVVWTRLLINSEKSLRVCAWIGNLCERVASMKYHFFSTILRCRYLEPSQSQSISLWVIVVCSHNLELFRVFGLFCTFLNCISRFCHSHADSSAQEKLGGVSSIPRFHHWFSCNFCYTYWE